MIKDKSKKIKKIAITATLGLALVSPIVLSGCENGKNKVEPAPDAQIREIYDMYVAAGNTLTYEEWLATIKGERGQAGRNGDTPEIGSNGNWFISGTDTGVKAAGTDAIAPKLRVNSTTEMWEVSYDNGTTWTSLNVKATGEDGEDGDDGLTPTIGSNGNWFIGTQDTGVKATGENGAAGSNGTNGVSVSSVSQSADRWGLVVTTTYTYSDSTAEQPHKTVLEMTSGVDYDRLYDAKTTQEFNYLLSKGATRIVLTGDIELTDDIVFDSNENGIYNLEMDKYVNYYFNLNNHELKFNTSDASFIQDGATVVFENGNIIYTGLDDGSKAAFKIEQNSSICLNNVTMFTDGSALFPRGDAASVIVKNSTIEAGTYCVGTNASTSANAGVQITISNSTLTSCGCEFTYNEDYDITETDYDDCTVMLNVAGSLSISDSTLNGNRQALFVRAGTATVTNSSINTSNEYADQTKYYNSAWGAGNNVPTSAVVVGNRYGTYTADATLTISNSEIVCADSTKMAIYVYGGGNQDKLATVNMAETSVIGAVYAESNEKTIVNAYASSLEEFIGFLSVGANITLTENITVPIDITATRNTTIDLNEKTLTLSSANFNIIGDNVNDDGVVVSISNGTIVETGANRINVKDMAQCNLTDVTIDSSAVGYALAYSTPKDTTTNGASGTLTNVTITAREACLSLYRKANVTVAGCTFTSTDNATIMDNGTANCGETTLAVSNSTLNASITSAGYIACGIYHANTGDWTISSTTINVDDGAGIVVRAGNITINSDVEVEHTSTNSLSSGRVGDATIQISVPVDICEDLKANYPGGTPTIINNSELDVVTINTP